MRQLERKPKVENFQDKLVIQKTVCLLELLGFNMGYDFSMYIRGPYSPDLTGDLYKYRSQVENLRTDYAISDKEKSLVAKVCATSKGLEPALLEIMATYAFLVIRCSQSNKDATVELKRIKPFYSEAKIAVGISRAKQLFPPTEAEVERMKAEFRDLEDASVSDNKF